MGQRARLYAAEDGLIGPVDWYASVEGAQYHVDEFLRKKWWKTHSPVTTVVVEYPAKETGAVFVNATTWRIGFRPSSLNSLNMAHELTHVFMGVTPNLTPEGHEQDHSAHFAAAEIELVRRLLGADVAKALRRAFEAGGVLVADVR